MKRSATTWPLAILLMIVLLPAVYMGTYYAMLKDRISLASPPAPGIPFDLMLEPVYRSSSPVVRRLLEPAHQVDRRIRAAYWGE